MANICGEKMKKFKTHSDELFYKPVSSPENKFSFLFQKYLKAPIENLYLCKNMKLSPFAASQLLLKADLLRENTFAVNTMASFYSWFLTPADKRKAIIVDPETAKKLCDINLGFIPETPPKYWGGNSIIIESKNDRPIVDDLVSITAYFSENYYFISCFYKGGDAISFNIPADSKINETLAKNQALLSDKHFPTVSNATGKLPTKDEQLQALAVTKFLFVTTYYIESQKYLETIIKPGLPKKNEKGKVIKKKGVKQYQWRYVHVNGWKHSGQNKGSGKPLNKENLTLTPTIVSGYVTMRKGKVVIVDPYDSHRWKNLKLIGTKIISD